MKNPGITINLLNVVLVTLLLLATTSCDILDSGPPFVGCNGLIFGEDGRPVGWNTGDVNLNGVPFEIADAVMLTNYMVYGESALPAGAVSKALAQADVTCDGAPATVHDLVCLARYVYEGTLPNYCPGTVVARLAYGNGVFSIDARGGAALIVVQGDVSAALLSTNMDMRCAFDGTNTTILVYSLEGQSFIGDFLYAHGQIVSTELAGPNGEWFASKLMPCEFALQQNYPNPFYPTTTINFQIPVAGQWELVIKNEFGEVVARYSGYSDSGFGNVVWDATGLSSGIYYYTLAASGRSATKKAVISR